MCIRHKLLPRRFWTLHLWVGEEFDTGLNYARCLSLLWKEPPPFVLQVAKETLVPVYRTTRRHIPQHCTVNIHCDAHITPHQWYGPYLYPFRLHLLLIHCSYTSVVHRFTSSEKHIYLPTCNFFCSLQFCPYQICLCFVSNISLPFVAGSICSCNSLFLIQHSLYLKKMYEAFNIS
jgi:hypothetical protein